jgi:hypothetical protein
MSDPNDELRRLLEDMRAQSQAQSQVRSTRLTARLIQTVWPLFVTDDRDHLVRIGTYLLVRIGKDSSLRQATRSTMQVRGNFTPFLGLPADP